MAVRAQVQEARKHAAVVRARSRALQQRVAEGGPGYGDRLSPRESQALRHLSAGLTSKEIALRMGISQNTANYHLANVYRKLGTHSRVAAANAFRRMVGGEAVRT